jgi:hypothetical protein
MLKNIWKRYRSGLAARPCAAARPRFKPILELLEDRAVPTATLVFSDSFPGANSNTLPTAGSPNWLERTPFSPIGIFNHMAAPGASASGASVVTSTNVSQLNVRLAFTVNLGSSGASTRGIGGIARYVGSGDHGMYLGWIAQRGGATWAEIWENDPAQPNNNGGWFEIAAQRVTGLSGSVVFDVESVSPTKTSLALYYNGAPVASIFDTTSALQVAGRYGIRSYGFRPTLGNFNAYALTSFGYDDLPATPPAYSTNTTPLAPSASTYIDDHLTGRVGLMTVNYGAQTVTMAASGTSLTTLNSAALTNGGWTGRAADVEAEVNLSGVSLTATGAAGFTTNDAGPYLNNQYLGWLASRNGTLTLEIYSNDPGDELDLLAASTIASNSETTGILEFKEVGNYLTLTYTPDGFPGDKVAITALDFHSSALGAAQVGIIGYGTGAIVGGLAGQAITVSVPAQTNVTLSAVPYTALPGISDNFYDVGPNPEWTSQLGSLLHAGGAARSVQSGDAEEGPLGASIVTLNTAPLHDSTQGITVDLSAATGPAVLGGVITSYTGPGDANMYLGAFVMRNGVASVEIDKNVNGTWQYLATSGSLTAGANMANLTFTVSGASLSLSYLDNLADAGTVSFTDSTNPITGNGLVGIRTFGNGVVLSSYSAQTP